MSKQLPQKDVEWVARLAYIKLDESEKKKYAEDLSAVLGYVEQLSEVDTAKVDEVMQITGLSNAMAKDEVNRCEIPRDEFLKRAPQNEKGYIKVKSVFDR